MLLHNSCAWWCTQQLIVPLIIATELSRRDDLESLGYSLLSLMRPLPWYWVQTPEGSAHNDLLVVQSRAQSSLKELCRGFPGTIYNFCSRFHQQLLKPLFCFS